MRTINNIIFKVNKPYHIPNMRYSFYDIFTILTINGFNVYTIFEIINSKAFPIILALGSLALTILLIISQVKKNKLLTLQLKNEEIEIKKKELELRQLENEDDIHPILKIK